MKRVTTGLLLGTFALMACATPEERAAEEAAIARREQAVQIVSQACSQGDANACASLMEYEQAKENAETQRRAALAAAGANMLNGGSGTVQKVRLETTCHDFGDMTSCN